MTVRPLRAVFFDMDGLIIDTESPDFQAWAETLADVGIDLPLDLWTQYVGTWGAFERLFDELGVPKEAWQSLRDRKRTRYLDLVRSAMTPRPGFLALLARCRDAGAQCAVVSTASRDWVDLILGELGLLAAFDFTLSGSDVERRKPAPDLYLLAAKTADVFPRECLVLEDSVNGVLAARRAGTSVIAVPNPITARQVFTDANATVESLEQVDDALLARIGFTFSPP